ncbi:unnamed protein product [Caenorhabditis nigoni]
MTENREEKKFLIKHVFENIPEQKSQEVLYGNEEQYFGIFWKLGYSWKRLSNMVDFVRLEFRKPEDVVGTEWLMEFEVDSNLFKYSKITNKKHSICGKSEKVINLVEIDYNNLEKYLVDGSLEAEFQVKIKKMTGFKLPKLRNFDDDVAKKFSDICLMAGNQKFYVLKLFLASHSTYFESLFLGNFSESQKSIIELKDIDPEDFQNFLEVLYGEPSVCDDNCFGILKLADMYDAKTAIRRCEEFLMKISEKPLKLKFHAALKYKMEKLKVKCYSEIKKGTDFRGLLPPNSHDYTQDDWMELLEKVVSLI